MANADTPFGLKPIQLGSGQYRIRPYYVPATYATALFIGDPVIVTGTANTSEVDEFIAGSLPEVNKATAGTTNKIAGVIVAVGADPDNRDKIYSPASTEAVVWVCDDPDALFEIQADNQADIAATDIGSNANVIYTDSGDTTTGLSGVELDTSSMTTTVGYQLKIQRLVNRPDNELGTNAKLVVSINNHFYANAVVGI